MAGANGSIEEPAGQENGHCVVTLEGEPAKETAQLTAQLQVMAEHFKQTSTYAHPDAKATRRATSMLNRMDTLKLANDKFDGRQSMARMKRIIGITLQWERLNYSVTVGRRRKRKEKTILQDISGHVESGHLLAIMGPTGSGKTSLLNALAGRLPTGGSLDGEVLVNGRPRSRGFRSISAYVLQDDVLFANLTVRETFEFAVNIRLPASVSKETKSQLVDDVIAELALSKAANTFIGSAFIRGVSGGERKRANIGVELLSNPSLVFLDEPTSGLDAFQAQNVMEALWTLAGNGRTVVLTIHQPRSSIYKMFDQLMLLSEGRVMYFGAASQATAYFAQCGFECPAQYNPGDFLIDVTSMDYRSPEAEASTRERVQLLGQLYDARQGEVAGRVQVDEASTRDMQAVDKDLQFANSVPREFLLLLGRAWRQASRNKLLIIVTLAQTCIIALMLAWLYSDMDQSYSGIQDETGILFFATIFTAMGAMFGALSTFSMERGIVNRERASKSYHVLSYYIAKFICDIPLRVGQGLLFGAILYWIVGLNPSASAFFIFCCIVICEGLAAQGLGVAISAAVPEEKIALAIAPMITVILMLFGGFYANVQTIPAVLRWIRYISHLYWAFMAFAINDFSGREGWGCPNSIPPPCSVSGDQILAQLGFSGNHLWQGFVGLLGLALGYNTLGYLLLRFTKPRYLPLTSTAAAAAKRKRA
jgi:ABC-type multidrug transport system ATPase subunit/ABC-type multidrug transport system permease subunit